MFYTFLQKKKNIVLFATDIAARGIDFPSVDWVIQLDCPENVETYIHRVGRTARYKSKGNSILCVNSKEEEFISVLKTKQILIKCMKINQKRMTNLQSILRPFLSESNDLMHLAQKAIACYVKSVYLRTNKNIFDIGSIDIEKLSLSFGLINKPEILITNESQNNAKNLKRIFDDSEDEELEQEPNEEKQIGSSKKSKLNKLKEKIKLKKLEKEKQKQEKKRR